MQVTVLGGTGFIGRHLIAHLREQGVSCDAPARGDEGVFTRDLGNVIYCIGMTADFRRRPFDTVDAHIGLLTELLRRGRFNSLLYLSSTRVYAGAASTVESDRLSVDPSDPSDLYNLTKLTGEALCLGHPNPQVRVARLSNVYGVDPESDNFLPSVLRDAVGRRQVILHSARQSEKDYIAVEDVITALVHIAFDGRQRLYNVAAGENVDNGALLDAITALTGAVVEWPGSAEPIRFAPMDVDRLAGEIDWAPARLLDRLPELIESHRQCTFSR